MNKMIYVVLDIPTTAPNHERQVAQIAQEIRLQYGPDVMFSAYVLDNEDDLTDWSHLIYEVNRCPVGEIPEVK